MNKKDGSKKVMTTLGVKTVAELECDKKTAEKKNAENTKKNEEVKKKNVEIE